jgi:pimeloyl-ACP methyl ester carboxylesterase
VLASSAGELRSFDARGWEFELPPVRFLVPADDSLISPRVQRKHARRLAAEIVEIPQAGHSFFIADPQALVKHLPA